MKYLCQGYGNDLGKCHRVVRTCPGVVQYAVCSSPVFSWRDHLCSLVFVHGSCGFDVRGGGGVDSMYGVLGMCR